MRPDMDCKVCLKPARFIFSGELLAKYQVAYFECDHCGYVQTEEPFWLAEAYASPINSADTGIMLRNGDNVNIVLATLFMLNNLNDKLVDYAGGFGVLVRLLRDRGIDAYWMDKYCDNLFARGFEYRPPDQAGLLTAFEVLEHLTQPREEINGFFDYSKRLLASTYIIPTPTPAHDDWWYYGKDHGQHIGFFRIKTLHYLANQFNKKLLTDGQVCHLFYEGKTLSLLKWKTLRKLAILVPKLLAIRQTSKVWSDHLLMSKVK